MLEPVGLTELEERVYEALVLAHAATLSSLAGGVGASRAKVAHAMNQLVELGLVNRLSGAPARYSAITPDLGLVELVRVREEALSRVRTRAAELTEASRQASRMAHPAELVEIVTGGENVYATFVRLQAAARRQLRGFDVGPYIDADPTQENTAEAQALGRGVAYRTVYDECLFGFPGRSKHVRAAIDSGEQARVAPRLPMKMLLCDEQTALIPVGPPGIGQAAAYLIYPSSLLDAISALFESVWDGARRLVISPAGEMTLDGLSELDIRLLQLLATGATDSTIARVTGCSLRTVQRRIRVMMHQLGVRTRFQAGLEARSRHWI